MRTQEELAKELRTAIAFDIRDNPEAAKYVNFLTEKKGVSGARTFLELIKEDVAKDLAGNTKNPLFPWTRSAVRTYMGGGYFDEQFGLGQWGALIGGLVGGLAQAGAAVYGAKLGSQTQLKLTKLQMGGSDTQAQAQAAASGAAAAQSRDGGIGIGTIAIGAAVLLGGIFVVPKLIGGK